jgi:phosphoribosylanthranilate isomerase
VKICGLTRPDDALQAAKAGADFLGMVFAPGSKRMVDEPAARAIVSFVRGWFRETNTRRALTPQCGPTDQRPCPKFVGVFVDEAPEVMNRIAGGVGLDFIQLHGDERPGIMEILEKPVIRAVRVVGRLPDLSAWDGAEWILFDAAAGGSGETFDWSLLAGAHRPFLLAGGLTPDSAADALRITGAAGVDVASGVESAPGVKDHLKVRQFVAAAKLRTEN